MKQYRGTRTESSCEVVVVREGDETRPLHHVVLHSPTGLEWGYAGSGPADLALSLLADASGDGELAERYHQAFRFEVVSRLPREGWTITAAEIKSWLEAARAGLRPAATG